MCWEISRSKGGTEFPDNPFPLIRRSSFFSNFTAVSASSVAGPTDSAGIRRIFTCDPPESDHDRERSGTEEDGEILERL